MTHASSQQWLAAAGRRSATPPRLGRAMKSRHTAVIRRSNLAFLALGAVVGALVTLSLSSQTCHSALRM
eukprot:COSAG01_NODE_39906_length_470_cov_1.805930_1_plen_68_part_01